jgi:hypothetical protein
MVKFSKTLIGLVIAASLNACGGSSEPTPYPAAAELADLGYGQYLGASPPSATEVDGEWTHLSFDPAAEGPICLTGKPFQLSFRDGPSDEVLVFQQGGGACWDDYTCNVAGTATTTAGGPPNVGILALDNPENPFRDFDIVYIPYCDGSVFIGDTRIDYNGRITYHHGLQNLSAGISALVEQFPNPSRVVVSGSSAGGYGTYAGYGVLRVALPSTEIIIFNDSGPGVQNKDASQAVLDRLSNWDFERLVPPSCVLCDDQYAFLTHWAMERDKNLRTAIYTYQEDGVLRFFLDLSAPGFKSLLLTTTDELKGLTGDRVARYFPKGSDHTILMSNFLYEQSIDGTPLLDWLDAFLADDKTIWQDVIE